MNILSRVYFGFYRRGWYFLNKGRFKKLGKSTFVRKPLIITPRFITIFSNVFIQANARIEGVSSYEGVVFFPHIVIDENCTIQQNLHLTCAGNIYIGKNTAIAANVTITDIDHPYVRIDLPVERQQIKVSPVYIADECKIYNNVVVLPGTRIGKHCVIGANSVISGKIPDYSVVVGAPGRIIKRYCFESEKWRKTDEKGDFTV
jgi:acetyltransferase-like isoleucine patch superfamily enzyme